MTLSVRATIQLQPQLHRGTKKLMLIKLYNNWHTMYWVHVQKNSCWLSNLTYVLLLYYFGKQVKCIMITFSPINKSYTLQLHS